MNSTMTKLIVAAVVLLVSGGAFVAGGGMAWVKHHFSPLYPEMVQVPAGEFSMGCNAGGCAEDELPTRDVRIESFYMSKYELTFDEWQYCIDDGGCEYKPNHEGLGKGRHPITNVSWDDAQEYIRWINRKTGDLYRLPTESEWEYAARAGSSADFSEGQCLDTKQANYDGNFPWEQNNCPATQLYAGRALPVGSYPANGFGLHDMHGNVWEWVEDCWHEDYKGAPSDGSAWISGGDCNLRLMRGGSWYDKLETLRASIRYRNTRISRYDVQGIRLVKEVR